MLSSSFFNHKATPTHSKNFCSFDGEEEGEGYLSDDEGGVEKPKNHNNAELCSLVETYGKISGYPLPPAIRVRYISAHPLFPPDPVCKLEMTPNCTEEVAYE